MKVKMLSSYWSDSNLENKINEFIEYLNNNGSEVIEIQYRPSIFYMAAMIIYK